jgi:hypothetical protein
MAMDREEKERTKTYWKRLDRLKPIPSSYVRVGELKLLQSKLL